MDGKLSNVPLPSTCTIRSVLVLNDFQQPPPSTRPAINGYTVSYKTNEAVLMYTTNDTVFIMEIKVLNVFNLTVFAFNILGKGEEIGVTSELSIYTIPSILDDAVCKLFSVFIHTFINIYNCTTS